MVHILGGVLCGASFSPLRIKTQKPSDPHNLGHFFMAIDPRAFREPGEFEDDLDAVIDTLHAASRPIPRSRCWWRAIRRWPREPSGCATACRCRTTS
jgi:LDH2 family malate/lactate/ureidoglycolate dehydrogenase